MNISQKKRNVSGVYGFPYIGTPSEPGKYSVCVCAEQITSRQWLVQDQIIECDDSNVLSRFQGASLFTLGGKFQESLFSRKRELLLNAEWNGSCWMYSGKQISVRAWASHTPDQLNSLIRTPKGYGSYSLAGKLGISLLSMQLNGLFLV